MANDFESRVIFASNYRELYIVVDLKRGIDQFIVDTTGKRCFGKPGTDGLGDRRNRNGSIKFFARSVGKRDGRHSLSSVADTRGHRII